jgi:hypothetical protein
MKNGGARVVAVGSFDVIRRCRRRVASRQHTSFYEP